MRRKKRHHEELTSEEHAAQYEEFGRFLEKLRSLYEAARRCGDNERAASVWEYYCQIKAQRRQWLSEHPAPLSV